jgi:hypothetical protein
MAKRTEQTSSPIPRPTGVVKLKQVAAAGLSLFKPARRERPAPSREEIGARAYEIWRARGCEDGHDQEYWFEAERELQRDQMPKDQA